jgi:Sulfotransferase family
MFAADELVDSAAEEARLDDFGAGSFRDGLERLVESLRTEAQLTEIGEQILGLRLRMLLVNRLRIEETYREHPSIDRQEVDGPVVIIGLPRTGTTALSQLIASDPQIRSLRLWESSSPVPPPLWATQHDDPRIAQTQRGLDAMYEAFPKMASLYHQTATGATECQDLLGMEFRTAHFDGMARVPGYTDWVVDCDMAPAYSYHRRTLKILQWRCPPSLWHLKTPVHMLHLDRLAECYPGARFLWTHRDPAAVLGSVCSLIAYTRSWVSDVSDPKELGTQQLELWCEATRRAMAMRDAMGEERFADVSFRDLDDDPVGAVARSYERIGLTLDDEGARRMTAWALENSRGTRSPHEFSLAEFGLEGEEVRERFTSYLERFGSHTG